MITSECMLECWRLFVNEMIRRERRYREAFIKDPVAAIRGGQ